MDNFCPLYGRSPQIKALAAAPYLLNI
ncbi:hypothetical protein BCEN4_590057 [Burkholderia cenocepacia]|nr:hypothetical protein BCEN4_590057 [Burkholderia cenocepacia]